MNKQSGFTLIELVMVIVILGVLAAVAMPKFVDMKGDAQQAAVDGVAGSLSSAASINFAARSANVNNGVVVTDCQHVANALQGGLPSGYSIAASGITNGSSTTCAVTGLNSKTANFIGFGITP